MATGSPLLHDQRSGSALVAGDARLAFFGGVGRELRNVGSFLCRHCTCYTEKEQSKDRTRAPVAHSSSGFASGGRFRPISHIVRGRWRHLSSLLNWRPYGDRIDFGSVDYGRPTADWQKIQGVSSFFVGRFCKGRNGLPNERVAARHRGAILAPATLSGWLYEPETPRESAKAIALLTMAGGLMPDAGFSYISGQVDVAEESGMRVRAQSAAAARSTSEGRMRLEVPADLPVPRDRAALAQLLASFGAKLVREVSDPTVIAVFRLAIAEAAHAPEVARALDSTGREASRAALRKIMAQAQASGRLIGRPADLAAEFAGLLWRDLMVSLLLGVAKRPTPREIAGRARDAVAAFLQLHPSPNDAPAA
jgi:hypothetical protein